MKFLGLNQLFIVASGLTPLKEGGSLLTDSILIDALIIMGVGFTAVFIVLSIIYGLCQLLNRFFPGEVETE